MKKVCLLLCILILSLTCGCQSKETESNEVPDISNFTEPSVDIDFGDTTYHFETDCQNYFNYDAKDIAAGPDGYYSTKLLAGIGGAYEQLSYIDRNSGQCILLCNKADCDHDKNSDCDAYTSDSLHYLTYYDDNLYTIRQSFDESTYVSTILLHRISADGSQRNDVCELFTESAAIEDMFFSASIPNYTIHRGYLYYFLKDIEGIKLYKKSINSSTPPQLIMKNNNEYAGVGRIMGYGDGVLFDTLCEITDKYSYKLLYYNEETDKVSLLIDEEGGYYTIAGDYIIYQNTELTGMTKFSLKDYTSEVFAEGYIGQLSYDGNYVYIDNHLYCKPNKSDRTVTVFDIYGNLIDTIDMAGEEYFPEFGDEYYLFKISSKDDNIYMLDKNQIGTGNHEWIKIE